MGTDLQRAVLRTVHYADLFGYPLKPTELHAGLAGVRVPREDLDRSLGEDPLLRARIVRANGFLHLDGRPDLAALRHARETETDRMLEDNRSLLRSVARLPFVRLLAFSGGTSHKNSIETPDVDLFVVTASGRTWTVYALLILLARIHRKRSVICFNYLIDEDHLALRQAGNYYTGHELIHLRPLVGADIYRRMLRENAWALDMFPNATPGSIDDQVPLTTAAIRLRRGSEIALAPFWALAERLARALLRPRLARKPASADGAVILEDGILKLHLKDHLRPILHRFRERLEREGLDDPAMHRILTVRDPSGGGREDPGTMRLARPAARGEGRDRSERNARQAWDEAAARYDAEEDQNPILRHMRRQFHGVLSERVGPGARVLDLGCGTGRDTLWMLDRGAQVTAVDVSGRMLAALRRKARAREENGDVAFDRCEAVRLPLDRLDRLVPGREGLYDGAIADFGSLNCVADLEELARSLERLVRPGGWVVAAVMNRTCLTETLHFLLRLKPRSAARRWRRGPAEVPLGSHRVRVRYLTPGSFAASFSGAFGVARCTAHPLLVPPPYLARMFAEDPARLDRWIRWDRRLAVRSWAAALGDHFLIEMVRNNDAVAPTEREHA